MTQHLTPDELQSHIDKLPRMNIAHLPTPLEEMPRLTERLGGPDIWIKREDMTGLAYGGNKARHYEFEMPHVAEEGYDVMINIMDYHSNNARMTAAAANKIGMRYILVLRNAANRNVQGNLLVDKILGAELHLLDEYQSGDAEGYATKLKEELGLSNAMEVPRVTKITLNMGVGEAVADKKQIENAVRDMTAIAGQKPVVTKARKSIAGFKIRDGWPIGCKVTLRGEHMWEFLDRLIAISIPRIRDFRGLSGKSFDGRGNYSMGVREQIMFPEIDYDKVDAIRGLDITITTSADTDEEGKALLKAFNFPFRN